MFKFKLFLKSNFIIVYLFIISFLKRSQLKKIDLDKEKFCFIISSNRSGASLLSSIISQNKNVVLIDGLFGKKSPKKSSFNKFGHTFGFSESSIWKYLNNSSKEAEMLKDGFSIWAHPKNISFFYKERTIYEKIMKVEIKLIILKSGYKKNTTYLIKDPYNIVRVKLISKIFPNSKIIINRRNHKEYLESCFHLWSRNYKNLKLDKGILLHWYTSNMVAIFETYLNFNKIFYFNHEDFYNKNINNLNMMKKIENFLEIEHYKKYNFKEINQKNSFIKTKNSQENFNNIKILDLAKLEKKLIGKFK